jgi:hypothetical protein
MHYQKIQFPFHSKLIISFLLFLIVCKQSFSHGTDTLQLINNLCLEADIHYGTILPHNKIIEYSLNSNIERIQITLTTKSYGRSAWDKCYRFPDYGAGYLLTTLGNKDVFGRAHGLFLFMNIPFTSKQKKIAIAYQIHFGLAYLDHIYDVDNNPLNMAISSHLNVYGSFNINARYRFLERHELSAGFNLSHFSNGKLATPNLGINACTFSAGYAYDLMPVRYFRRLYTKPPVFNKHQFEVIISGGTKTDDQVSGRYYYISTLVADYKFVPGLKYSFGVGSDFFYDPSLGENMIEEKGGTYSTADLLQFGIHGGLYARYSRLNILLQIGAYAHANYYKYARVYSRVGFRYEVAKNILLNLSLKSHYAIADYIEWGIGYRF